MQQSLQLEPIGAFSHAHRDVVFTPEHIALAMVRHFQPAGKMLGPCKGDGAFFRRMPSAKYCELQEGRDFFDWNEPVDWIVSNPPYSIYLDWMRHSFEVAENIVYLVPLYKALHSSTLLAETFQWGGIVEIVHIGTGRDVGFDFGFAAGAVHYQRGYRGGMRYRHGF